MTKTTFSKTVKNIGKNSNFQVITSNKKNKLNKRLNINNKLSSQVKNRSQIVKFDNKLPRSSVYKKTSFNFSLADKNNWEKVLPTSCNVNPLYLPSNYPWAYRMSAAISNYHFGKKSINNLLTFNINLPVKHQLRGAYFFSNYDTTNYGKLEAKRLPLYRLYPSLLPASLITSSQYIYKQPNTACNLAYLPVSKYNGSKGFNNKISGNFWFIDSINNIFLRRYHNIQSHNIMSREIDSVVSMFDRKLSPIFDPLSATYNLQRLFTLGLSPNSKVFMPQKYLRSRDNFHKRFMLWSHKYSSFWSKLQTSNVFKNKIVLQIFDSSTPRFNNNIILCNKLQRIINNIKPTTISDLYLLKNKYVKNAAHNILSFNLNYRVGNLRNNIFKGSSNKFCININQGLSLISNMLFSTKKLAVIKARTLYHYYPFYTKKSYGTGIKQNLISKSTKFAKTKLLFLNQMLQFTNILNYRPGTFNRMHQLSQWIHSNNYISNLFDNKSLLNVLTLPKNKFYLSSLISNRLGAIWYKIKYHHLIPGTSRLKTLVNKQFLYTYLTKYHYNVQLYKKRNKNRWYTKHTSSSKLNLPFSISLLDKTISLKSHLYKFFDVKKFIKDLYKKTIKNLYKKIINNRAAKIKAWKIPRSVSSWRLTIPQWLNILRKKKALWFSAYNNQLTPLQEYEKQLYLQYNKELHIYMENYDYYLEKHHLEQKELLRKKLKQEKLKQKKLEQQIQAQEKIRLKQEKIRLEQEKLRLTQEKARLEQEQLKQQKLQQKKLYEEKRIATKQMVEKIPLGVKMPYNIWRNMEDWQQTLYHIHQKKLRKEAKKMAESFSNGTKDKHIKAS